MNTSMKETIENYEYAKHVRNTFYTMAVSSMLKSTGITFIIFLWMRLVKHKGKKDLLYLGLVNAFISLSWWSMSCYYLPSMTRLPMRQSDLNFRKDLIEDFVLGNNKSMVLTEEIKKISKFYVPKKIEHSFVTSLGQKVTLIAYKGRLYVMCDNYAEVFGYSGKNKLAKMDLLDVNNLREREIIYGLFKFYDVLTEEYKKKYKIEGDGKNLNTEILEEIAKEKNLNQDQLEYIKNSKMLKEVQFNKLKIEEKDNKL